MTFRALLAAAVTLAIPLDAQAAQEACKCEDFDKLQQELDNAVTLRDRHARKAEEMADRIAKGVSKTKVAEDYARWETGADGAGQGIVGTAGGGAAAKDQGGGDAGKVTAISYTPAGLDLLGREIRMADYTSPVTEQGYTTDRLDPKKAKEVEDRYRKQGKDLCDFADRAAVERSADATSPCKEVRDLLVAHENIHRETCRRKGFFAFVDASPVDRALDEVKAYDAQIAALQKLLGQSLKGAEVQFEDASHVTYSGQMFNFRYSFTTEPTRAQIPDNDGKSWSASLKGVHRTKADSIKIAGMSCTMTPITRDVEMQLDASGKTARVTFVKFGPVGSAAIKCPHGGGGGGSQSPDKSGESVSLPLKLSAGRTDDVSKSRLAGMMAGVAKVTGTTETKLGIICPAKPK